MNGDLVPFDPGWGPLPVDSDAEIDALIGLWALDTVDWRSSRSRVGRDRDGKTTLRVAVAEHCLEFDITSYAGTTGAMRGETDSTETMDLLARRAQAFSAENPPHHPGSVARFPVPSRRYARSVEVPLPIVAIDGGQRGLYAPPRVALMTWPDGEPTAIGEFPGFDPESWPPERLGAWPPPSVAAATAISLRAAVARFSACWVRIIDAALAGHLGDVSVWDRAHARSLRRLLDLREMQRAYGVLNPEFDEWLTGGESAAPGPTQAAG